MATSIAKNPHYDRTEQVEIDQHLLKRKWKQKHSFFSLYGLQEADIITECSHKSVRTIQVQASRDHHIIQIRVVHLRFRSLRSQALFGGTT